MTLRAVVPLSTGWRFREVNDEFSEFLPVAQMPTNVHLDLMHNGIIPDPFVGKNETLVQWVGEKAWVYRTSFQSPLFHEKKVVLAFDGLDTFATVRLNGHEILESENMFTPERVNVTEILRLQGENVLEITFDSTFLIGKKIVEKYPKHHWGCQNGDVSRLAVRKAQYHYVNPHLIYRIGKLE